MKKLNKKGFTIVELVIVIAIIAVLAAVMIPTFSGVLGDAKDSAATSGAQNAYTQHVFNCTQAETDPEALLAYNSDGRWVKIVDGQHGEPIEAADATAALKAWYDDAESDDDESAGYSVVAVDGIEGLYKIVEPAGN